MQFEKTRGNIRVKPLMCYPETPGLRSYNRDDSQQTYAHSVTAVGYRCDVGFPVAPDPVGTVRCYVFHILLLYVMPCRLTMLTGEYGLMCRRWR